MINFIIFAFKIKKKIVTLHFFYVAKVAKNTDSIFNNVIDCKLNFKVLDTKNDTEKRYRPS